MITSPSVRTFDDRGTGGRGDGTHLCRTYLLILPSVRLDGGGGLCRQWEHFGPCLPCVSRYSGRETVGRAIVTTVELTYMTTVTPKDGGDRGTR